MVWKRKKIISRRNRQIRWKKYYLYILYLLSFLDIKKVSDYIGTRTVDQVRSHLQKIKQNKEKKKIVENNINSVKDKNLNNYNNKIISLEEEINCFGDNKEKILDSEEFDFRESKNNILPIQKKK